MRGSGKSPANARCGPRAASISIPARRASFRARPRRCSSCAMRTLRCLRAGGGAARGSRESRCRRALRHRRSNGSAPSTPALMDARLQAALDVAAEASAPGLHLRMPSGAGHDAQWLARKLPAAMMFVPSIGGISHHWTENTSRRGHRARRPGFCRCDRRGVAAKVVRQVAAPREARPRRHCERSEAIQPRAGRRANKR